MIYIIIILHTANTYLLFRAITVLPFLCRSYIFGNRANSPGSLTDESSVTFQSSVSGPGEFGHRFWHCDKLAFTKNINYVPHKKLILLGLSMLH